jgi:hypothetical protein
LRSSRATLFTSPGPTQSEPPFAVVQVFVLALFVGLGIVAAIRFRAEPVGTA